MQKLFTTFARGWPGRGLFILRLVTGIRLIIDGVTALGAGFSMETAVLRLLAAGGGLLLLVGFWTPIAGTLVAILELDIAFFHPGDPWISILLATVSAALTLTGPGAWSVDALRFGLRRVDFPDSKGLNPISLSNASPPPKE